MLRRPAVAGSFYPRGESECRRLLEECLARVPAAAAAAPRAGGIVPHAGWVFSGPTAARVFRAFEGPSPPRTFVLFGAVHVRGVRRPALYPEGAWWTPVGTVEVDADLAREIGEAAGAHLASDPGAHDGEHSLEVQVPFIRRLFPDARIVPILVPPGEDAVPLGERVGALLAGREGVAVLGSTDLTHYGPRYGFTPVGSGPEALRWAKEENDRSMIDLVRALRAEEVLSDFRRRHNACGPGAIAAAVAAARAQGAREVSLLEHITSAEVRPEWGGEDFVGYAGIVFSWPPS